MAWARVQSASHSVASGNGTVTLGSTPVTGNKIICFVSVSSSTGGTDELTSVTDSNSNTVTKLVANNAGSGSDGSCWVYLLAYDVPATPSTTLTATWNTAGAANFGLTMLAQEVSGLLAGNTSAMLDGTPGTSLADSTGPAATGSYTSTASNEYLAAMFGDAGNAITVTNPSGYTADANNLTGSSQADLFVTYKNSGSAAESASFTISAAAAWGTIIAAFKLGAVITTGPPLYPEFMQRSPGAIISSSGWRGANHSR